MKGGIEVNKEISKKVTYSKSREKTETKEHYQAENIVDSDTQW